MKAVFPCKGVIILTKNNVSALHDFYQSNLVNSKLFPIYNQSNYSIQVGAFNYLPKKTNIVLENAHFLTLQNLHNVLRKNITTTPVSKDIENSEVENEDYNTPLDDNFIVNHPFFKTLKPLN